MKDFGSHIKSTTGLDLLPAPDRNGRSASQCGTCLVADPTKLTFILNVTQKWNKHARSCPGLKKLVPPILSAEAQNTVMHVTLGSDKHRKNTTNAYVTTYWIYKHKLTFTTGNKLREVCLLVCNATLFVITHVCDCFAVTTYNRWTVWPKTPYQISLFPQHR